ncbi:MAG: adenosylcobinamide-GDP ribazoletransferase [Chloroflexota bacterium]
MTPILAAFQFLTIFPAILKRMFTPQEMGRAAGWFPLVGVALGFALYGVNFIARLLFPQAVSAALTLFAWVMLTRAFHLDGFMDSCDGLFGGWTPERRLEIMKDSRMGAFGVAGGVLVLLTKYAALSSMNASMALPSLLLAATLGRWALPLVIFFLPYARKDGIGFDMKNNVTWREIVTAALITGMTAWLSFGWLGLGFILGAAMIGLIVAGYVMRLLPGLTGDIYGAVTILVEMLTLVCFTAKIL